jgi:LytS/YehU family sensor histidine kinase
MKGETLITAVLASALVIFILIVGVVLVIIYARRQRLRQELNEANYKAKITDISFAALRSQMNPHFIFNCLNSIKYFTEQNNNEAASEYLSKFARLIRRILDNARCEKITLEEEIDSLKLYLELEAMRFKEKLQFIFDVKDNVDTDFIEIPPMIIQPYIENAIWHGLMPKENGGLLKVSITQQDDVNVIIVINDNGIGRVKAAEIKNKKAEAHVSYGTKITGERINLINEKNGEQRADVKIIDEYDENNAPCGTTVIIKLPIK